MEVELIEKITKGKGIYHSSGDGEWKERPFNQLIDIEELMKDKKSSAYQRWTTVYNLKQMVRRYFISGSIT